MSSYEITKININDIHGADYNPREISHQELTKLKNNIDEFGIVDPIIVNLKNNNIVGGHQRYKALQSKGEKDLQMIKIGNIGWVFNTTELDIPDEDAEKILNLSLNNISGEWNEKQLSQVLQDLKTKGTNYKLTGFDDIDLERLKIDTEVLFEENIIGKSWDKFQKAKEELQENTTNNESNPTPTPETPTNNEITEEEELQQLQDGIIRDETEEEVLVMDEINCPHCGKPISIDLFMEDYYDKVDEE